MNFKFILIAFCVISTTSLIFSKREFTVDNSKNTKFGIVVVSSGSVFEKSEIKVAPGEIKTMSFDTFECYRIIAVHILIPVSGGSTKNGGNFVYRNKLGLCSGGKFSFVADQNQLQMLFSLGSFNGSKSMSYVDAQNPSVNVEF